MKLFAVYTDKNDVKAICISDMYFGHQLKSIPDNAEIWTAETIEKAIENYKKYKAEEEAIKIFESEESGLNS
jgi:hypothetical protein